MLGITFWFHYTRISLTLFLLTIKERMIRKPIVAKLTDVPIKLFGLNTNPIKIILKDTIAKIVV